MINGIDDIFFTKLDVLDEFDEIKVVTDYLKDGKENRIFDPTLEYLENVKPVTRSFPGWKTQLSG